MRRSAGRLGGQFYGGGVSHKAVSLTTNTKIEAKIAAGTTPHTLKEKRETQ
jgi:hypothetical protein